jgi:osmoprotectant transport system permease protein
MNLFLDAIAWILDPAQWEGRGSIPTRVGEHLWFTAVSVLVASVIAIPLGWLIGHTGRGRDIAVAVTGAARALPSFGLLFLFVLLAGVSNREPSSIVVLVLLAIPPILAGAYSGFEAIDRRVIDAARSVGMTEWQIVGKVEIPLGLPLLWGGLRSAVLQVVATVVLIGFVGLGGLGEEIVQGIALGRYEQMLGASLLIVALALVLDGVFALLERYATPGGVRAARARDHRTAPTRRRAAAEQGSAITEKERSV